MEIVLPSETVTQPVGLQETVRDWHIVMKKYRKEIQMIFQDPYSSLDPRMTVLDIIGEPIRANYPRMKKDEREALVKEIAEKVVGTLRIYRSSAHAAKISIPVREHL